MRNKPLFFIFQKKILDFENFDRINCALKYGHVIGNITQIFFSILETWQMFANTIFLQSWFFIQCTNTFWCITHKFLLKFSIDLDILVTIGDYQWPHWSILSKVIAIESNFGVFIFESFRIFQYEIWMSWFRVFKETLF